MGTSIYQKLFKIQNELEGLKKTKENPFHKSSYIDINGVLDVLKPKFQENNVLLLQPHDSDQNGDYVITRLVDLHDMSEVISKTKLVFPDKGDPQKYGSSITYARRYGLISLLGLEQKDDDGCLTDEREDLKKLEPKKATPKKATPKKVQRVEIQKLPDNLEQRAYDQNVNYQAGEYVVDFGKDQGRKLNQFKQEELQQRVDYWLETLASKGERPKGKLKTFLEEAQSYLSATGDGIPF